MRFSRWSLSALALVALTATLLGSNPLAVALAKEAESKDAEPKEDTYVPPDNSKHFQFQAEVHKMLDIVVNSLYQNRDVFLRELISNASDALDKLRFLSLTKPELLKDKEDLEIRIEYDSEAGTLTVRDSGIGMTEADLIENLGTVARSGTTKFVEAMQQKQEGDLSNLIGQFGVGFYSSFLVADRVTVASKSPNETKQFIWESLNGAAEFHVYEDPRGNTLGRGTEITLHLKEDCLEFSDPRRVRDLVKHYSEFIMHPIHIRTEKKVEVEVEDEEDADKKEDETKDEEKKEDEDAEITEEKEEKPKKTKEVTTFSWEEINNNPAIWTRDKDEITDDEYQAFWKVLSTKETNATAWTHFKAEGNINFKSILYLPPEVPEHYRLGQIEAVRGSMRLYVRRVLISDEFDLLPRYLGFIRGVVDSDDLPLNVNRETLQESKILKVIKKKLVRKSIELINNLAREEVLAKQAAKEAEVDADGNIVDKGETKTGDETKYLTWYKKFAPSIKMGVIDDHANRPKLATLLRYKTSRSNGTWISLADYVQNMKPWQDEIYTLAGISVDELEKSPFLEPFREKDVEVIYFTDPVDEYVMHEFREFQGKNLISISSETVKFKDEDEDLIKRRDAAYTKKFKRLTSWLKEVYGSEITKVIVSKRLGSTPAIVSNSQYGHSANMERIIRSQVYNHDQEEQYNRALKVFEINPRHPIVLKLLEGSPPSKKKKDKESSPFKVSDEIIEAAWLLHDMAMLNGGFQISDPVAHSQRMLKFLQSQLSLDSLKLEPEIDVPAADEDAPDVDVSSSQGINADDFNVDDLDLDDA